MGDVAANRAEAFVLNLCRRSVLSLWCYNNPRGKNPGKELCDILVVCDPHVIIVSVKEVLLREARNPRVDFDRWQRKAITASIKQIRGAERHLTSASHVIRSDGTTGLKLPSVIDRKVHRIAVAFGGQDKVPITSSDDGKGFVHVMTERSFREVLTELDTITDLVDYLTATETCAARRRAIIFDGSESNLLGWYLFNGRTFPESGHMFVVGENIWKTVQQKPEFKRRKEVDRDSYHWDRLIELLSEPNVRFIGEPGAQLTDFEIMFRCMARENRFSRRTLGRKVYEFFQLAKRGKIRSRVLVGLRGIIYVFVYFPKAKDRDIRIAELKCRCFIARHKVGEGKTIIGIGINEHVKGVGSASDLIYMDVPTWSASDDETAERLKADLGFFGKSHIQRLPADEYPAARKPRSKRKKGT